MPLDVDKIYDEIKTFYNEDYARLNSSERAAIDAKLKKLAESK